MANKFKHTPDGTEKPSIYKGDWAIELTPNDIGGGLSTNTGLYNGAHVPEGGYAIYTPGKVYVALNDLELTGYITGLGGDGTNRATALTWASTQNNVVVATSNMTEIVTDGLLLKFSPGNNMSFVDNQPTSNLNPYVLVTSSIDGSGQGSVGTRLNLAANHVRIFDVNSNTRQSHLISGLSAGTYTASIEFKKLSGTPTFRFQIQGYVNASYNRTIKFTDTAEIGIEDKGGWQTASWTFDLTGSENAVRLWYQDGADYATYTHSFELRNPQLESGSIAAPYHIATRNQTVAIHDLGAHNAHGSLVNGVSLHSNGYLELDGVDDKITIPNTNGIFSIGTAPFSLNLWVKQGTTPTYSHLFTIGDQYNFTLKAIRPDATSGHKLYVFQGVSIIFHNSYLDPDNWQMITLTRDGDLHKLYINGVLSDEVQYPAKNIEGNEAYLGHGWSGEYTEQKRGDVQLYNRVLDPSEILQNYYQGDIVTSGLIKALDFSNPVCYEKNDTSGLDLTNTGGFDLLNSPTPINTHGGGISFGEDNEFLVLDDLTATNYVTVECWYTRHGDSSSEDIIFNKESCWELKDDGGVLQWALYATNKSWFWQSTGATINVGETAHLALSYDGNQVKFHKNGVLVQTYAYPSGGLLANTSSCYPKLNSRNCTRLSVQAAGNHDFYQFRIYDRALLDSEVLQNFRAHRNRFGI